MTTNISGMINNHRYPRLYYKFPFLIRLHHHLTKITTLRNWYVKPAITKILGSFTGSFSMYDAGCGAGDFILPYISKYSNASFIGVDKIADNINICETYSGTLKTNNCSFINGDIESFVTPLPVDLITCITVLQYTTNDLKVLNNFYKSLKPGGILLLYVPVNYKRLFPRLERFAAGKNNSVDYDNSLGIKRRYTRNDIKQKLSAAGFKIIREINTYKTCGKISFELFTACLAVFKRFPLYTFVLALPAILLLFPFIFLLMAFDIFEKDKEGNGILFIVSRNKAAKTTAVQNIDVAEMDR